MWKGTDKAKNLKEEKKKVEEKSGNETKQAGGEVVGPGIADWERQFETQQQLMCKALAKCPWLTFAYFAVSLSAGCMVVFS